VRALVLDGDQEFSDPWHDLAATSGQLAEILERDGFAVETRDDVADALAQVPAVDVIVVNCSGTASGEGQASRLPPQAVSGLMSHVSAGRGLLAVHSAVMAFADWPGWAELIGARWRAESMHPRRGPAYIRVRSGAHSIVEGISDFVADDERYSYLERSAGFLTLAEHRHEEQLHPLIWARTAAPAKARLVYDGLGHDLVAYENPVHRELIRRAARWIARG
jgi:type 1 glutamine amidotransferase